MGNAAALAAMVMATPMQASAQQESDGVKSPDGDIGDILDESHAGASSRVRKLGAWLDHFFADDNYVAEVNRSRLQFRAESFSEMDQPTEVNGTARLQLVLPALSERLRFEFLSPGETGDLEATGTANPTDPPASPGTERPTAAISYFLYAVKERSIIARLGMDFEGYNPNPFVGLRYRESASLGEDWDFHFVERVRFYSIDGLESRTTIDFDHAMREDSLMRLTLDGTWLQQDPAYFYSAGISLQRSLDEHKAVAFEVVNDFKTHPHRLDRVTVRLRHRQTIWREWLSFDVAPQVSFPADNDFKGVPGILIGLEASFGG